MSHFRSFIDPVEMLKNDLFTRSDINPTSLSMINEKQLKTPLDSSVENNTISDEEDVLYLDIFTSHEILPYFIVSSRAYLLVVSISRHHKTDV